MVSHQHSHFNTVVCAAACQCLLVVEASAGREGARRLVAVAVGGARRVPLALVHLAPTLPPSSAS
eukprot:3938827-Rhodomonas_salina.1